jgi:hypothetical protein
MRPGAIEHITINTGAVRMSPRSEVDDHVVQGTAKALKRDGKVGKGWTINVLTIPANGAVYDLMHDQAGEVARCWLCLDPALSDATGQLPQPSCRTRT